MRIFNKLAILAIISSVNFGCKPSQHLTKDKNTPTQPVVDASSTSVIPVKPNREIISVTEMDSNGKTIRLGPGYKVVDPNSSLKITIDQTTLYAVVATENNSNSDLIKKLGTLKKMLLADVKAINVLKIAISGYNKNADWKAALGSLREFAVIIFDDPIANEIYISLPPTNDIIQQYSDMFVTANIYAKQLEESLKVEAQKNGIYLQMGGWINSKGGSQPVHIPGFDDIATNNFRVEQFQLVLTDEQKKELDAFSIAANKANEDGLAAAFDTKKAIGLVISKVLGTQSIADLTSLQKEVKKYLDSANLDLANARQLMQTSFDQIQAFRDFINIIVAKYKQQGTLSGSTLLAQVNSDISEIEQQTKALSANLTATATGIENNLRLLSATTQAALKDISPNLKKIPSDAMADIKALKKEITSALDMIVAGENLNSTGIEFTKEVKKLSFDQVQQETTVDLESTGKREIGDTFTVRLSVGRPDGSNVDIANLRYYLYFCTPYVQTAVSFLFTDPVPIFQRSPGKALFQYAPSYSILLKGIWKNDLKARRSLSYHNVYSPGIGVNIATLDFNGDGAPEVGVGAAFSIFRDFLQIGYGINTFEGRGYSFFGFKLPVGALSLR